MTAAAADHARAACHGPFGRIMLYLLDRPMPPHAHRQGHLIFLLSGAPGVVVVGGRAVRADTTNVVAINPWEPHAYRPVNGPDGVYLVLYMDAEWFGRAAGLPGAVGLRFATSSIARGPHLARLVAACAALVETRAPAGALRQAALDLGLACATQSRRQQAADPWLGIDRRLRHALPHLAEGRAPLAGIAAGSGLSRAHFHRLCQEQIGASPRMLRNTFRIERALDRVAIGSRPIAEIGEEIGFACQSRFSRFFAAHVGMAPAHYRRAAYVVPA